jgi:hypothetical protein
MFFFPPNDRGSAAKLRQPLVLLQRAPVISDKAVHALVCCGRSHRAVASHHAVLLCCLFLLFPQDAAAIFFMPYA